MVSGDGTTSRTLTRHGSKPDGPLRVLFTKGDAGPPPPRRPRCTSGVQRPCDDATGAHRDAPDRPRDGLHLPRGHARRRSRREVAVQRRRLGRRIASTRGCATRDIVPLLGTEQLTGDRLPFLDSCDGTAQGECDEYPVLTMWTMRLAAWLSGDDLTALLPGERDHPHDRGVRDRAVPVPDGRRPRALLRAGADAPDLRLHELGPARGRLRDGGDARVPATDATSGRACCSASAPPRSSIPRCW